MSWAEAERRGISADRILFLWGSGDAYDSNMMGLRHKHTEAPAIKAAYSEAFRASGLDLAKGDAAKIPIFDIYSCFPVAVEQACKNLGIDPTTPNIAPRLTQTGGLPYHGGPGSNYSLHGLCAVADKLRTADLRGKLGMVCANGGVLTEQACGIYSTTPPPQTYVRRNPKEYAPDVVLPYEQYALTPNGKAKILTWTVDYKRNKGGGEPETGIVIGEMTSGPDAGKRFFANPKPEDKATLSWLLESCKIGSEIDVECSGQKEKGGPGMRFDVFRVWFKPVGGASKM